MPQPNAIWDVLVVGAGPVGLAAAIELGRRGHSVHVVEQSDRIGRQPRAKTTNVRSMAHMRRWGLAEQVRAASPLPADHPNRVVFATGLFGHVLTDFSNCFNADRTPDPRYPEPAQWIPQYEIERILRDCAAGSPTCRISLGCKLTALAEDPDSVTAEIEGVQGQRFPSLRARYVIGADGAHSTVRDLLGIGLQGDSRMAKFLTLILRAPGLADAQRLGPALMYWLVDPKFPGVVGPMDRDDVWFWGVPVRDDGHADDAEIARMLASALGPDQPFEVLAKDFWIARRMLAESYGTGRVWLAGDACHLHPPFGGYGMNLGIADAVDLGWKISATLLGWGGPKLLPSYETERRPVHAEVITESTENMALLGQHFANPLIGADGAHGAMARAEAAAAIQAAKDREFHSLGLVLGYSYRNSPIIAYAGATPRLGSVARYEPEGTPGALAPHAWLEDGTSIYDHFGPEFTLLDFAPSASGVLLGDAGFHNSVTHRSFPSAPLRDLYGARFSLVRPDQHVAWRGDDLPDPGSEIFNLVVGGHERHAGKA